MTGSHATVVSVNVSPGGIPKRPIDVAHVLELGLGGDGHNHPKHGGPLQALCLFDLRVIENLRAEGFAVHPGSVGENLTIRGIDLESLAVGDRLLFSGGVEAQISKRRSPCGTLDSIHPDLKKAMLGRSGWYARVLVTGEIRAGETIEVVRASVCGPAPCGSASSALLQAQDEQGSRHAQRAR
jgi:MOSC domain-containing protein YiiM